MIHERLKSIRMAQRMSMKAFAAFLDTKYTTYVGYESGTREPGSDFLAAIAQKCHVTVDYLIGVSDTPQAYADQALPPAQVVGFTGDPAKEFLSTGEYTLLLAYRAADDRAREDALSLLVGHKRQD